MKPLTITPPKGEKVKQITRNDDGTVTIEFEADSYKFEDLPKIWLDDDTAEFIDAQIKLLSITEYFGKGRFIILPGGKILERTHGTPQYFIPCFRTIEIAKKVYEQNKELFEQYWRS